MQKRKKEITFADTQSYVNMYIRLISDLIPGEDITPREIELLSAFLSFRGKVAEEDRFSSSFRKAARRMLQMGSSQMTNIINDLTKKGIIMKNEYGDLYVDPIYIPPADGVTMTLVLHGTDDRTEESY